MTHPILNSDTISLPAIYSEGAHFQDRGFVDIHTNGTITWRSATLTADGAPARTWTVKDRTTGDGVLARTASVRGAYRFGSHRYAHIFRLAGQH